MITHLRAIQVLFDFCKGKPLLALERINLTKSLNCLLPVKETVASRSLAHRLKYAFPDIETDFRRKDARAFCQLASLDQHMVIYLSYQPHIKREA